LKPGGFVEVEFTHQDRTVLARIADTGGEWKLRNFCVVGRFKNC
jgi:hypothetical protein